MAAGSYLSWALVLANADVYGREEAGDLYFAFAACASVLGNLMATFLTFQSPKPVVVKSNQNNYHVYTVAKKGWLEKNGRIPRRPPFGLLLPTFSDEERDLHPEEGYRQFRRIIKAAYEDSLAKKNTSSETNSAAHFIKQNRDRASAHERKLEGRLRSEI